MRPLFDALIFDNRPASVATCCKSLCGLQAAEVSIDLGGELSLCRNRFQAICGLMSEGDGTLELVELPPELCLLWGPGECPFVEEEESCCELLSVEFAELGQTSLSVITSARICTFLPSRLGPFGPKVLSWDGGEGTSAPQVVEERALAA